MRDVMNELVTDASALVYALTLETAAAAELRARLEKTDCHAPHLVDAEFGQALRRHERLGQIDPDRALSALRTGRLLVQNRYPHDGLFGELAWSLRKNLSFYDALYVALAAALQVPLLTADVRLAGTPGLPCEVDLIKE